MWFEESNGEYRKNGRQIGASLMPRVAINIEGPCGLRNLMENTERMGDRLVKPACASLMPCAQSVFRSPVNLIKSLSKRIVNSIDCRRAVCAVTCVIIAAVSVMTVALVVNTGYTSVVRLFDSEPIDFITLAIASLTLTLLPWVSLFVICCIVVGIIVCIRKCCR